MIINIPVDIGDKIIVNGKIETVKGVHVYVTRGGEYLSYRVHIGDGKYIKIEK